MESTNQNQPLIVAIDGPSASGKSTLGRALAQRFYFGYVDSGAVYRTIGYLAKQLGIEPFESDKIISAIHAAILEIDTTPDDYCVILNGSQLKDDELRHPSVTVVTAALATLPEVRVELTRILRKISHPLGLVMDGRDVGTNVFPNARVKLFLEADSAARAARRWIDEVRLGRTTLQRDVEIALKQRDRLDSERAANPLVKAQDAITINTTILSIDQVIGQAAAIIETIRDASMARTIQNAQES